MWPNRQRRYVEGVVTCWFESNHPYQIRKDKIMYDKIIGFIAIPIDFIMWNKILGEQYGYRTWGECWKDYKKIAWKKRV